MMIDLKVKIIIAISILCLVLGYLAFRAPKVITKVETKTEIREVVKYVDSHSVVTGGTSATVTPAGTAISGHNLTITSSTTITELSTTKVTEKVTEKFSESGIFLGGAVMIPFDVGPSVAIKLDRVLVSGEYYLIKPSYAFSVKYAILTW